MLWGRVAARVWSSNRHFQKQLYQFESHSNAKGIIINGQTISYSHFAYINYDFIHFLRLYCEYAKLSEVQQKIAYFSPADTLELIFIGTHCLSARQGFYQFCQLQQWFSQCWYDTNIILLTFSKFSSYFKVLDITVNKHSKLCIRI